MLVEPLHPEAEAAGGHRVGDFAGLAGAAAAGRHMLPGEEREDGAGRALLVAEVEVVGARVVEVDGALEKAQAQDLGVEVEIAPGVARNGRDMVQAEDAIFHE